MDTVRKPCTQRTAVYLILGVSLQSFNIIFVTKSEVFYASLHSAQQTWRNFSGYNVHYMYTTAPCTALEPIFAIRICITLQFWKLCLIPSRNSHSHILGNNCKKHIHPMQSIIHVKREYFCTWLGIHTHLARRNTTLPFFQLVRIGLQGLFFSLHKKRGQNSRNKIF